MTAVYRMYKLKIVVENPSLKIRSGYRGREIKDMFSVLLTVYHKT
jgi:hypothetical protein